MSPCPARSRDLIISTPGHPAPSARDTAHWRRHPASGLSACDYHLNSLGDNVKRGPYRPGAPGTRRGEHGLTDSHAALMSAPGDIDRLARDVAQDPAVVGGLLSEITTSWRRAQIQCGHGHPWPPGHVIISYVPCQCRAVEGISGHTVVRCARDGCRSAWYRPRHYPPDATPSRAAGEPGGSHHHPMQATQRLLKRSTHRQLPGTQLQWPTVADRQDLVRIEVQGSLRHLTLSSRIEDVASSNLCADLDAVGDCGDRQSRLVVQREARLSVNTHLSTRYHAAVA